jgi:Uncharacterized protein containing caspase domain
MRKIIIFVALTVLVFVMSLPHTGFSAANEGKPIHATNIEIVKKASIKGKPVGGKPTTTAATGILGATCTGTKYAIVIGINDYPGDSSDLQYCVADAESMKQALTGKYGYPEGNIVFLTNGNANRASIESAITSLKAKVGKDDEVFFFFSGHGAKGKADDGDNENIDESIVIWGNDGNFDYLWDGKLKQLFDGFATNRIIFAFDSCLSGGMTDLALTGRVINMACSESGVSYEFSDLGHGQFTYYFVVEGMISEKADTNPKEGKITVEEAFDYAASNCVYQKPTISDQFQNDLLP